MGVTGVFFVNEMMHCSLIVGSPRSCPRRLPGFGVGSGGEMGGSKSHRGLRRMRERKRRKPAARLFSVCRQKGRHGGRGLWWEVKLRSLFQPGWGCVTENQP